MYYGSSGYTGLAAGVFLLEAIKLASIKMGHADRRFSQPFVDMNTALIALFVLIIVGSPGCTHTRSESDVGESYSRLAGRIKKNTRRLNPNPL